MPATKKEQIKDQMIKTAARLWNVPDNEIETNFDPLILLLIEACAAELEKIGFNINASQNRLLDSLADLIIPEAVIGPKPASCVASAFPVETSATINTGTTFSVSQRMENASGFQNKNLFFAPAGDFLLHKAKLSYLLIGKKLFKINSNGSKELTYSEESGQSRINGIWLAIEPDKNLTSLNGLSIYLDMRGHSKANLFYSSLISAKASIENEEIKIENGYYNNDQFELDPEEMLVSGYNYLRKINRNIAENYQKHFLYIADEKNLKPTAAPLLWQEILAKPAFQKVSSTPLIFLKINFESYFLQEELEGLTCCINAFPLVNKKCNTQNYRTDPWINIVPLHVEGSFLDLENIITASGSNYKFRIAADAQSLENGEAFVRSSGVNKASSKEVREILNSLATAIRDENSFFSEMNNDFILARLKEINQVLARLDDRLQKSSDKKDAHHYILLKPKTAGETITITYWTTDGEAANQVRAGASLTPHNNTIVAAKDAFTFTNPAGGKTIISETEKRFLLKQQILSNGKIISAEDVKMLCRQLFEQNLISVQIKKGVQTGNENSVGFSRTIDVILSLKDNKSNEVLYLSRELETALKNNATLIYPFRVIIAQ